MKTQNGVVVAILVAAWLVVAGGALAGVTVYAGRPGKASAAGATWPGSPLVARTAGSPTLLLFAHTQCPCTRASLRELEKLLVRVGHPVDVWVLFSGPDGNFDLRASARAIPGVHVVDDAGRAEARRFGAATSGATLLYGADGALLFSGGITSSRGHEGDNAGSDGLVELLKGAGTPRVSASSSVFGCALFEQGKKQ